MQKYLNIWLRLRYTFLVFYLFKIINFYKLKEIQRDCLSQKKRFNKVYFLMVGKLNNLSCYLRNRVFCYQLKIQDVFLSNFVNLIRIINFVPVL